MSFALSTLKKRGPDNTALYTANSAVLGHTRLSVIDTAPEANQPMQDVLGRYTIVFNGEIYNYQALRRELQQHGVNFATHSDTEVLLYSYIHYGSNCLNRLNGFFAFAIYDAHKNEVFAARDRYGIKPLLYSTDADRIIFSSQLQPFPILGASREIDQAAFHTYFRLSYIPAPDTIFREVKKLMPGQYLVWNESGCTLSTYYKPKGVSSNLSYNDARAELRRLLETAIEDRLVADVPLGTFLSGGLDSSIITSIASRYLPEIPVFSIGFPDHAFFDETAYAANFARKTGVRHRVFNIDSAVLNAHLGEILHSFDEPFADSSAVPFSILSKYTRNEVKVALSGDGADELFGGYHKHRALLAASQPGFTNALLRGSRRIITPLKGSRTGTLSNKVRQLSRYTNGLSLSPAQRYWEWASFATVAEVDQIFQQGNGSLSDVRLNDFTNGISADFNSILLADLNLVLPNDMLKKVDLMSMNHGLEVRVPFLDHRVVEFANSLPASYKTNARTGKRILRDAFASRLPKEVLKRRKRGFEVPMAHWLQKDLQPWLDQYLNESHLQRQGIFDYQAIKNLRRQVRTSQAGSSAYLLWAVLVFQAWYSQYIDT